MIQGVDPRNDPRKIAQRYDRLYGAAYRPVGRTTKGVRPPRTVLEAARELTAPELRHTIAFRKAAFGVHDYSGVNPDLLRWKRAFEKVIGDEKEGYCWPLYCIELSNDWCSFVHFTRVYDLRRCEWEVISALAAETARRCEVQLVWGGSGRVYHPSVWQVAAGDVSLGVTDLAAERDMLSREADEAIAKAVALSRARSS